MNSNVAKAATQPGYTIIIPDETMARANHYLRALRADNAKAGNYLAARLKDSAVQSMTPLDLLGELLDTKRPQIFAESAVVGDGTDWNPTELGLLGDVSIAVQVTVFDDGNHHAPTPHSIPFPATLVFTPGALLNNGQGQPPADWGEATGPDGQLSSEGYYELYRRRLLPAFRYVNHRAAKPRSAILTIPGLGCGQFAGPFRGELGVSLQAVLERLLSEHGDAFPNFKAIYFDPYRECKNTRREIRGISMMVRPLMAPGNDGKSQLCHPAAYAEEGDVFSNCELFSIVAWDHVSWPGNDFFLDARATDDGVKAAATSSMSVLTGVPGSYDRTRGKFRPPSPFRNWEDVVRRNNPRLWNQAAVWTPQQST